MQEQPRRPWLLTLGMWLSVLTGAAWVAIVGYEPFDAMRSATALLPAAMLFVIAALIARRSPLARPLMVQYWIVAFICHVLWERFDSRPGMTINGSLFIALAIACYYLYDNTEARAWFGAAAAPAPPANRPIGIPITIALSIAAMIGVAVLLKMQFVGFADTMFVLAAAGAVALLFVIRSPLARIAAVLWWHVVVYSLIFSSYRFATGTTLVRELLVIGVAWTLTAWYFFGKRSVAAYYDSLRTRPLTT